MSYFMKMFIAIALVGTNIAHAAMPDGSYSDSSSPYSTSCCPLCHSIPMKGTLDDFFFTSDVLIFKACEDGLAFGTQTSTAAAPFPTGLTDVNSRVKNVHPKWSVGYRLGINYVNPCNCWVASLFWTHFDTHMHHTFFQYPSIGGASQSFFTPGYGFTGYNSSDLSLIGSTYARWKLRLNLLDVEFSRLFCITECLTLRPHAGIRAAWMRQSYIISNTVIASSVSSTIQQSRLKFEYEGAGLRGGLDTEWNLGCGLSLYGNAAVSTLYGVFNVKSQDAYSLDVLGTSLFDVEQKDDIYECSAVTDAALGLRWKGCFCDDTVAVTLNLGWEHHMFFNQNHFEDFVKLSNSTALNGPGGEVKNPQRQRGDLCLKGFTIGANLDY